MAAMQYFSDYPSTDAPYGESLTGEIQFERCWINERDGAMNLPYRVGVEGWLEGTMVVTVLDDGQGGHVIEGLGIGGMRSRVERLGGTLRVGPTRHGFEVRAVIPSVEP